MTRTAKELAARPAEKEKPVINWTGAGMTSLPDAIRAERLRHYDPETIEDIREFLYELADAEYFPDSPAPLGNEAMGLLTRFNAMFPER